MLVVITEDSKPQKEQIAKYINDFEYTVRP